jgi:hypothetical protein
VGRIDTGTLHEREPPACLDLGEADQKANVFNSDEFGILGVSKVVFRLFSV